MKIFDAIQQVVPCPRTKSTGCQCDKLEGITEAEETIKAIAQLEHTVDDVQGFVKFKQKPGQPTIIKGIVKGLTPGKHGFHIHEYGDLSDGCASAGGHYNPDGVDHGNISQGHVGDLGNITADQTGTARFQIKAERVELSDVVGRAIVIHADEDDLGKGGDEESLKTGNAGDRLGCGVIRLREVVEEDYQRKTFDKHFDRNQLPQINRTDVENSDFNYKEGKISLSNLKPVQSQRVHGYDKKAEQVFLQDIDKPFIIDKNGYIINGHHRYDAANILGIKRVKAIKIDADIEDVMNYFSHTSSDTKVMGEDYFKKLLQEKMAVIEDVTTLKPQTKGTKYPLFSKQNIQKAYNEWANGAEVDRDINIVGKDNKEYVIRQNYDDASQHFEEGEWYLTNANNDIVDTEGYPDPGELLYDHNSDEEFYPDDEVEEAKSSPGRVKRAGASCKGSATELRAKAKKYSGEKGKMYHWCANMKGGKKNPK
jgi:Cu/Zn superoxide dismutase/archaellum component FlaC